MASSRDQGAFFENAISWIKENLEPDEVFSNEKLSKHVRDNNHPQDVFSDEELESWAKNNDFTKSD